MGFYTIIRFRGINFQACVKSSKTAKFIILEMVKFINKMINLTDYLLPHKINKERLPFYYPIHKI